MGSIFLIIHNMVIGYSIADVTKEISRKIKNFCLFFWRVVSIETHQECPTLIVEKDVLHMVILVFQRYCQKCDGKSNHKVDTYGVFFFYVMFWYLSQVGIDFQTSHTSSSWSCVHGHRIVILITSKHQLDHTNDVDAVDTRSNRTFRHFVIYPLFAITNCTQRKDTWWIHINKIRLVTQHN